MAAGLDDPIIGASAFVAVKYFGYVLMAYHINSTADCSDRHSVLKIGAAKLGLGVLFGLIYWFSTTYLISPKNAASFFVPLYVLGLGALRCIEWKMLLGFYYKNLSKNAHLGMVVKGVFVSYLLDIPSMFGVFIVGGAFFC